MVMEDDWVASIQDDPVASIEVSWVNPILDPWWLVRWLHHHLTIVIGCLSDRVLSSAKPLLATWYQP